MMKKKVEDAFETDEGDWCDPNGNNCPLWFLNRMGGDQWSFGLLLVTGQVLAIEHVNYVTRDGKWLNVTLLEDTPFQAKEGGLKCIVAPTSRTKCDVQLKHVMAAFELSDT